MEKRIIIDEHQNVFALNGTNLEPLGEASEMKNVWQQKVFTIGKNLYFKKGNEIFLLAENIESTYEIKIDDFAWKQFELVGDVLVMVDTDMDGIKKLNKAYAPYLNWTIPCKEKPILFLKQENEKSLWVVIEDENGNIRLSEQKVFYLDKGSSFLYWNYRIYSYSGGEFNLAPFYMHLIFINDPDDDDDIRTAIAIDKDGNMTPLGEDAEIVETPNAILLKSSKGVYHLKKDAFRCVTSSCYSDNFFDVEGDGTIVHEYTIEQSDAPDVSYQDVYRLIDGEYRLVR